MTYLSCWKSEKTESWHMKIQAWLDLTLDFVSMLNSLWLLNCRKPPNRPTPITLFGFVVLVAMGMGKPFFLCWCYLLRTLTRTPEAVSKEHALHLKWQYEINFNRVLCEWKFLSCCLHIDAFRKKNDGIIFYNLLMRDSTISLPLRIWLDCVGWTGRLNICLLLILVSVILAIGGRCFSRG